MPEHDGWGLRPSLLACSGGGKQTDLGLPSTRFVCPRGTHARWNVVIFQNPGETRRDAEVYAEELALARQAEGLGFESIWSVEHHFTDYTMCPNVFQFLTYMAACTETIQLGSMVCVLPWHDPIRVAESIAMLDVMSGGRVIFGMGREVMPELKALAPAHERLGVPA